MKRLIVALFCLLLLSPLIGILAIPPKPVFATTYLTFAGYTWEVRTYTSGGKVYAENNAWVDSNGYMHLKISYVGGSWYCGGVRTTQSLGFGTYQWEVQSSVDNLDPYVDLGLYQYPKYNPGGNHHDEIDIEFAQWGIPEYANKAKYTVFPDISDGAESDYSFTYSYSGATTNIFTRTSDNISFQTLQGGTELASWTYAPGDSTKIPQDDLLVYMGLGLYNGHAPSDGNEVEAVITGFTFTPSGASANAGTIDHYTVTSDNYTQQVTVPFTATVTAYDALGNLVPADNVTMTMSSTPPGIIFDGNANGVYGETGDDVGVLTAGTLNIQAKAVSTSESIIISATDADGNQVDSAPYTIQDFRCFIATAAYGTPMIHQIQVLRDFRDEYLMTNPAGRWFVSTYYRLSPPLARFIANHDSLRALVRVGLTPVIWLATLVTKTTSLQKIAILVSMIAAVSAAVLWLRRRRQSPLPPA